MQLVEGSLQKGQDTCRPENYIVLSQDVCVSPEDLVHMSAGSEEVEQGSQAGAWSRAVGH